MIAVAPRRRKSNLSMPSITFSHADEVDPGPEAYNRRPGEWGSWPVDNAISQTRFEFADRAQGAVDREERHTGGRGRSCHPIGHERHPIAAARLFRRPVDRAGG